MTASWTDILRAHSLGAFEGPNGDYPSVIEALDELSAVHAAWKPSPDRHSIWQIVDHLAKSKEWERRIIEGERLPAPAWEDPSEDDASWHDAVERLRGAQAQLLETVARLTGDDLQERPETELNWPVVNVILNKAAHDAYHAGQIRYLRALQGALNDEMVTRLVRRGAIPAGRIEAAFRTVPRERFLPGVPLESVYSGEAVITRRAPDGMPISSSSMPQIMASMLEQLNVQAGHRVLEIGAGTGYNAAVLAALVGPDGEVTTVDIDEVIVREARDRLDAAGYAAVRTVTGDGWLGAAEQGPYDGIEVTVGVSDLSPAWVPQLRDGGRLVVPLWLARGKQLAIAFQKDGERLRSVALTDCGFMRLRGPHAGSETFVTVHGWTIGLDEADPTRVAALEALLALEPQIEPAPTRQWGWPTRLLLEEPGAIALSRENDWRKYGWDIVETAAAEPSLAFVTAQTWDYRLYTFGGDAARSTLLNWLTHARPFDIRHVSIEALPSAAVPPQDAMVLRRRNFQFVIQQRGGTM